MYALQNQNVERKIARHIETNRGKNTNTNTNPDTNTNGLKQNSINAEPIGQNETNNDLKGTTEVKEIQGTTEVKDIPDILIPRDDPEPLPQLDFGGGIFAAPT